MTAIKDMILALRGPAVARVEIPDPPARLSIETQQQLLGVNAFAGVSFKRRRFLVFSTRERVHEAPRETPDPTPIDWAAMRTRKVS